MNQHQELRLEQDVINGFSYSFSRALLGKLKQLNREGRVFTRKVSDALAIGPVSEIADPVIQYLREQMRKSPEAVSQSDVDNLIETTEEFLAAFEKSPKKPLPPGRCVIPPLLGEDA
ncbi:MAG: hypothetical protein Q7S15_02010 [bacterium]|nr:hypothetical protein [bacterium]